MGIGSTIPSPSDLSPLSRLRILSLRITAVALDPISFPSFPGSVLRGAFGFALKETVCVVAHRECEICSVRSACAFPYLFETPRDGSSTRLKGAPNTPHPYRIYARDVDGRTIDPDQRFSFEVILVGRGVELSSAVIAAFMRVGANGLTSNRGRFDVVKVDARSIDDPPWRPFADRNPLVSVATVEESLFPLRGALPPASDQLQVTFASSVRLMWEGRMARDVPFHLLVRNLLRRASSLLEFHEGIDLDIDYRAWIMAAGEVITERSSLRKEDSLRYSTRQRQTMNLLGLRGEVVYRGPLAPFGPLLALGEIVGVGKGTTFGLGQMIVRDPARLETEVSAASLSE